MKSKTKTPKQKYAAGFTTSLLRDHYRALIGNPKGLKRFQIIEALKGTQFDEHAYSGQ